MKMIEPEMLYDRFKTKWGASLKIATFTFVLGILVYIQMITDWLANPDAVWEGLLFKTSYSWEDSLGRIGLGLFNKLKGFFLYPALQTIFCLFLAALITTVLCELFQVRRQLWGIVLGFLMLCSPFMCDVLTYYFVADAYIVAFFLSVLFVYILAESKKKWNIPVAAAFLACSLSLYQAFLGTSITLCLLYLLYRLLKREDGVKKILRQGGRFLAAGGVGTLLYLLVYKYYCIWKGISPTPDRGFSTMGKIPVEKILFLIKDAYTCFVDYYFTDNMFNNSWHLRGKCNLIIFAIIAIVTIVLIWKKHDIRTTLLAVFGMLLLPLSFMSVVVYAPEVSVRDVTGVLMLPHMNFIYLFLIALIAGEGSETTVRAYAKWASLAVLTYMSFTLVMYVQIFQNCKKMELNKDYALAQRIVTQVESLPEYYSGMKLMIGGNAENGNYPKNFQDMYYVVRGTSATYGFFWNSINGRQNCWIGFLRNYLGVTYSACNIEEVNTIMESEEYAEMPIFPEAGSVRMIEGFAVVKLSHE